MERTQEKLTEERIDDFLEYLREKGCSANSLETYRQILRALYSYLPGQKCLTADSSAQWRNWLAEQGFSQRTVNSRVSVMNSLLEYLGHRDWQSTDLPSPVNDVQPELTRTEYLRLLSAARLLGRRRTYLLIKTLGGVGLRLQELPQLTVEAVRRGVVRLERNNQMAARVLRLPRGIREELLEYCRNEQIESGPVFVTRNERVLNRTAIQRDISALAKCAKVDSNKANSRCLWKMYVTTQEGIQHDLQALMERTYERQLEEEQLIVGWEE